MGAVKPDRLPGWAKEKGTALRQDYQRERPLKNSGWRNLTALQGRKQVKTCAPTGGEPGRKSTLKESKIFIF